MGNTSTATKKVDRARLLDLTYSMIRKRGGTEGEVSAKDLSNEFDVSAPTMDYHLTKLVNEGKLINTGKKGRYNCRIYRIPEHKGSMPQVIITNPGDDSEILRKLREASDEAIGNRYEDGGKLEYSRAPAELEPADSDSHSVEEHLSDVFMDQVIQRERNLDDYINEFQARSKALPTAENLLKKQDREIMSVLSESIHQHIVYLQDLSQQLSTIEDKKMIQMLIDERNEHLKQAQANEQDMKMIRIQMDEMRSNHEKKIDLGRVQLLIQNLYSIVDTFGKLPSHAQRLGFHDFKKQHAREVSALYQYISQYGK